MAMVSNKFLAAVSVKLGFHRHLRSNGAIVESQNREYVQDLEEVERDANGARDYWTLTKTAPKVINFDLAIGSFFTNNWFFRLFRILWSLTLVPYLSTPNSTTERLSVSSMIISNGSLKT